MASILSILDFAVVLLVVISVSRAVWKGPSGNSGSLVLSLCTAAALAIFGVVSLLAASGLTDRSAFHQGALLIFLVAIAVTSGVSWANKPVR
jgi:hypothetical protein